MGDDMYVSNFKLDDEQMAAIKSDSNKTLVVAGAGCGKTTTIVGKIKSLLNEGYKASEILILSFTNASVNDMKLKLEENNILSVDVYTFHKLAISILKNKGYIFNVTSNFLEFLVTEYFECLIFDNVDAIYCVLKYYNMFTIKSNVLKKYQEFVKTNKIKSLKESILRYIKVLKTNGYGLYDFDKLYKRKLKTKEYYFIKLSCIIYQQYEYELLSNSLLDFDDLIIKSRKLVDKSIKYRAIIVDEYQDTSPIRFLLIKEILDVKNALLFAVGDDFQSIYRFAGCDLNIMLDFKKHFPDGKIFHITKTYRNSLELIDIAGQFVMKNPMQIKKQLRSDKRLTSPIKIIYYRNPKKALKSLLENNSSNILILGRNNNDIYKYCNPNTLKENVRYMTIHRSKGLESDMVIVINLLDDKMGLPSKIKEEKTLDKVLPNKDGYPYSEERRLFYVALTRTKGYVYLKKKKKGKSIFITELEKIVKCSKVLKKRK